MTSMRSRLSNPWRFQNKSPATDTEKLIGQNRSL